MKGMNGIIFRRNEGTNTIPWSTQEEMDINTEFAICWAVTTQKLRGFWAVHHRIIVAKLNGKKFLYLKRTRSGPQVRKKRKY